MADADSRNAAAAPKTPAPAPPVIVAQALSKRFRKVEAVVDVSFSVRAGETVALLGGNGAGKTTTISMLLGLVTPSGGVARVHGCDMARAPWAALQRMNFQSPYVDLPRRLTVRQNLQVYARLYGVAEAPARLGALAAALDLEAFVDRPVATLSAGQRTRVSLAKALINSPDALLLDEPTASLDPDTADRMRSYLERYRADVRCAILLASHNMSEVERLADRVLMMKSGRIVDEDAPAALIRRYGRANLEEVFLDIARAPAEARVMIGAGAAGSLRRISALTLRYWHLLWGSWPRMVELAYWPTVMMVLWGFMQEFLSRETGFFANAFGMLLGAVMLWDACFRGQLGVSISFFEEMWSRNLGHLLVSPLRPWEWVAALFAVSLARTILGMTPASLLSIWFFNFSIYSLGVMLAVFFLLLIAFGWAIGLLVSGLVLRQGLGAETLAWAVIFALAPFSCVYYPLDSLPAWMQAVALALPTTHVFEGMRALLANESVRGDALLSALALDALYLGAATWWFLESLAAARDKGALLQIGE